MKTKIRVNPLTYLAYIPKELVEEGFAGDLDSYANAKTLTLVQSGASLEETERSLEIVLEDIRLRLGKPGYKVPCPHCGGMVLPSALESHIKNYCPAAPAKV